MVPLLVSKYPCCVLRFSFILVIWASLTTYCLIHENTSPALYAHYYWSDLPPLDLFVVDFASSCLSG